MSEEQKTKTISGAAGLQRRPEIEVLKEIAACEEDEATLFAVRGYGGYINSKEIEAIRQAKANCCAELADNHPKKVSEAKERARRSGH